MNWYYATADQTQAGPVDETTLQGLLASGTITSNTLVWRQGMDNWSPYSSVFNPPVQTGAVTEPGLTRCSECGQAFPPEQLISLAGRAVCGTCKPVAVQKFQEGVLNFGAPVDAEELWRKVEQRGFDFSISSVLLRTWNLVKGNFWPSLGIALLCQLITTAAGQIPFLGLLAAILVAPQLRAGLYWYFLKQYRGESATINDAFAGFRRGYAQQVIYILIVSAVIIGLVIIIALPLGIIMGATHAFSNASNHAEIGFIVLLLIPLMLALWYFITCWIFTPLLILEKGLTATAAMKLSRRVVHLRFWKIIGFFLVIGLLFIAGLLALIVGVLVMLPVAAAATARLYEDAFGDETVQQS